MGRIVVGLDGSDSSKDALRWAAAEARLRSGTLEVVCAYQLPTAWLGMGDAMGAAVSTSVGETDIADYANQTISEVIAEVLGPEPSIPIERRALPGHPADVLTDASEGADLLVVGSRGHGNFGSVLLGSVGMHCVHHASCPVVVVRGPAPG